MLLAAAIARVPPPVHGDFHHDGKPDVAEVVSSRHGVYRLIIRRAAPGHPISIIETFSSDRLPNLYVTTERPGRWRTWCGKGGRSDADPCPQKSVTLRGDTLAFGMKEASESVAIWTGHKFRVVLLSD